MIYGRFYKISDFKPSSIDTFFNVAPRILQLSPYKDFNGHRSTLGGSRELSGGRTWSGE
jgi:hypothetical protein